MVSRKRRREQVAEREETSATITRRRASNGGSVEPPSLEKLLGGPPPPLLRGRPRDANNVLRELQHGEEFLGATRPLWGVRAGDGQGEAFVHAFGEEFRNLKEESPEEVARISMTAEEKYIYDAWKRGYRTPELSNVEPKGVEGKSPGKLRRLDIFMEGLKVIYPEARITRELAAGCRATIPWMVTLVCAVNKVAKVRRALTGGLAGTTSERFQEQLTTTRVLGTLETTFTRWMTEFKRVIQRLMEVMARLTKRRDQLLLAIQERSRKTRRGAASSAP